MPAAALASGLNLTGAMLGFPGEDYTTPASIKDTGGFGNPATRVERLERLSWALDRTIALGLNDLMLHAGFIPEIGDSARPAFLDTRGRAASMAGAQAGAASTSTASGLVEPSQMPTAVVAAHQGSPVARSTRAGVAVRAQDATSATTVGGAPAAVSRFDISACKGSIRKKETSAASVVSSMGTSEPAGDVE